MNSNVLMSVLEYKELLNSKVQKLVKCPHVIHFLWDE